MSNSNSSVNYMNNLLKNNNFMNELFKKITSLKENFIVLFLLTIIVIIIVIVLIYYLIMRTFISRNCSVMNNLYDKLNGSIRSLNSSDPSCKYTLKDYYIKTAYNACSIGSYKNSFVSSCILKDLLRQGVRGFDFEIYSINEQPVVATSTEDSYFIKETYNYVPFIDVMSIVTNYAFSNSTAPNPRDPIIFHLRIKSTKTNMYQNLANIFKQYKSFFLGPEYSFENKGKNIGDVPILNLNNKIIIIVDRINDSFMDNKDFYEFVNMTSNSMFMRAIRYYDVKNTPDMRELQEYNKKNMSIAMPDVGSDPENPNPIICREMGCQMVAMMYQKYNTNLQADIGFYDILGYAFELKPERLRYTPVTIPAPIPQDPSVSFQTRSIATDFYSFKI